ncbi:hypothetical protein [Amycolatopsis taiwanensis]|uniref:hypothetical protein n=1 Tax=Amycolatopsis taiwanensis TaxID=342230 RepID=UPI0025537C08|nr:hypothetical protein [Amycolatopsis taiwanensis]
MVAVGGSVVGLAVGSLVDVVCGGLVVVVGDGAEHTTVNSTVAVPLAAGRFEEAEHSKLAVKWPGRLPARPRPT